VTISSESAATAAARTWRSCDGWCRLEALDLGGVDLGFLEGGAHRSLDPGGLLGGDPVFDEVPRHLLENACAPERCVQLKLGEP
jgi:hypothetical protein